MGCPGVIGIVESRDRTVNLVNVYRVSALANEEYRNASSDFIDLNTQACSQIPANIVLRAPFASQFSAHRSDRAAEPRYP